MRTSVAVLAIAAGVLLSYEPASGDTTTTNAYKTEDKIGTAVDSTPDDGAQPVRRVRSMSEEECFNERIKPQVEGLLRVGDDGKVRPLYDEQHKEDQGAWHRRVCYVGYNQTSYRVYWIANVDAEALARQALSEAPLPNPVISISAELPAITLTGYPQWLWIDPSAWRTVTASASLGGLTATVTAVPTRVTWDAGDSRASTAERYVNCVGPGKPLPANAGYDQKMNGSDCMYRYLHTSGHEPNLAFNLSASIYWNVTWTATDGTSGTLGPVSRTASIPVKVGENQVVNINPQEFNK